jgi:methionyl-tRNA formyltransferase
VRNGQVGCYARANARASAWLMRIVFMGTPQAAAVSLERLLSDGHDVAAVYTQPDRPSGRGNKITFSPVKQLALDRGVPVLQPTKIRTDEAIKEFSSFNADVAVVVAYGRILPESYLRVFPHGAINVHFSLLPKYRGAAPVNWAIVSGETKTGVTTMNMDAGLDTGDMLLQRETEIGAEENSIELMQRLSAIGADLLAETLLGLATLRPIKQDEPQATLAPIIKKEDGRFDWSMPADTIERMVRGFQPFPTTYTGYEGKKLTIWRAISGTAEAAADPGVVLSAHGDDLVIKCGDHTALKITELQLEGKRRMSARDLLNGIAIKAGDIID